MKLGIALSGGGIRGIAHAGVLQALEDNGIKPDIIGGTSCGSMIAVLYAMGYSPYHMHILFKRYAKEILKIDNIPFAGGIKNCFGYSDRPDHISCGLELYCGYGNCIHNGNRYECRISGGYLSDLCHD